jgi:5'(3')-deoxyribonucleotidase
MRIQELITESTSVSRSQVYLDMDGVLADFFTEYAKLAGVDSGKYRDIPPAKTDPTLNKMVGTDFFARLPKFESADKLVDMVTRIFGSYNICSSPLRGDHKNSEEQKKVWIQKHLNPAPKDIIITPNKAKYAVQPDGTPNILIDDRGSNIASWEAAGGVGIKYQADENGLDVVARGLRRAVEIIKGKRKLEPQKLVSKDRSLPVASAADITDKEKDLHEKTVPPPTQSQCGQKWLSNVRYSQCVSRGWKRHNTSHTDGNGTQGKKGTGKSLNKKKVASVKYGGSAKNYGGNHS